MGKVVSENSFYAVGEKQANLTAWNRIAEKDKRTNQDRRENLKLRWSSCFEKANHTG